MYWPSLLTVLGSLFVAYSSIFIYRLVRNTIYARQSGLPSIYVPWDQNHFVWMVVSVPLRPHLQQWLPKFVYDRIVLTIYGWEFHERLRPFKELSAPRGNDKSYFLVTCGAPELWTSDPEIGAQILNRPRDFQQVEITDLFMARFGHNLLTSNGDRWARQRKVVAGVINERISKATFNESIRQTEGMLGEVNAGAPRDSAAETSHMFSMLKKITINVLGGAGMGASVPWENDEMPKPGFRMTYIEAVKTVIDNVAGPIILPQWFLSNYPSFLPGHKLMNNLSFAVQEFPTHTMDLLDQERQRSAATKNGETRSNIMSQLLRASEGSGDGKGASLTDEEMMGNLFIFTAAGFDTTANTLAYAIVLLTRYPQWQDWLCEEVDSLLIAEADPAALEYTTIFPKATRILAFMLETLRLFPPVIHLAKQTRTPQTIQTSRGTYWLPANTQTYIDGVALGLDPVVWRNLNATPDEVSGNDEEAFRPSRWINRSSEGHLIFQPPKGTYVPWSAGPRVCPGQKMAQVEFTAVIMALLRRHRIDAVLAKGETRTQAEARLDARMRKSVSILTLQMDGVYDVVDESKGLRLRLSKRL